MVKKIKMADKWNRDYITIKEYKNGTARVVWDSTGDEERLSRREYKKLRSILEKEGIWRVVDVEHREIKRKAQHKKSRGRRGAPRGRRGKKKKKKRTKKKR